MKNTAQIFLLVLTAGQVFAQTPLQVVNCPGSPLLACDFTPNDASLWNELYWYDPTNNLQNLSEGPTDLSIAIVDTCAGISVRYLLFLDLDQNDTAETVIDSDNLPGYNNVQFGNAFNPNYIGGSARAFDERAVGANDKYGFALQTTANGDGVTAALRWNTQLAPSTYSIPELPYGKHRIQWLVTDACANTTSCEYSMLVKDCKRPNVVCINGNAVDIQPTAQIDLYVTDFLQYAEDNSSPVDSLKFGMRKSGTGVGFPADSLGNPVKKVTFDCSELGLQALELWGIDLAGNADFCETYVIITDINNICPDQTRHITTCVNFWKDGSPVKTALNYQSNGPLNVSASSYDSMGCLVETINVPFGGNFSVTPALDTDPLNGVNTLDLIRISRHILGLVPLAPHALIAADANKSGSVTTFDIMEFRKLLLGTYTALPFNTSWRFLDANFQFPNPTNPFQTAFPENATIANLQDSTAHFDFTAVKIGDVDGTAYPGFGTPSDDRATTQVTLPDISLLPGESMDLPLCKADAGAWLGVQMGLQFDPKQLQIESVTAQNLPGWDQHDWAQSQPGLLRLAWFHMLPSAFLAGETLLTLRVRALAPVRLRESISLSANTGSTGFASAAVSGGSEWQPLQLVFKSPSVQVMENMVFAPQPNPTQGADVQIALRLGAAETVSLLLTDLTGRILYQKTQALPAGGHLLLLPTTAFPQFGVYVWRVEAGTTTASGKVVKMQ